MTWKLQAITGELEGQEVTVDRDMLVGRHQDADLQLQAAEISRRHAAFLLKEDALWVQDLKSSNGTFVNDLRIDQEQLLADGDIVQFASIKFNVLAPVQTVEPSVEATVPEIEIEPIPSVVEAPIQQPSEAIATAEVQVPVEKTPAQQMNEQGMPELAARDANVQVSKDGMPTGMGVPKPAPIPADVDIHAPVVPEACDIKTSDECAQQEVETQKNAKVGLYTIISLVILAILAWVFFK